MPAGIFNEVYARKSVISVLLAGGFNNQSFSTPASEVDNVSARKSDDFCTGQQSLQHGLVYSLSTKCMLGNLMISVQNTDVEGAK